MRQARYLHVQQIITTVVKRSLHLMCMKMYNILPQDLTNEDKYNLLKKKLTSYMVEIKLYSVKVFLEN